MYVCKFWFRGFYLEHLQFYCKTLSEPDVSKYDSYAIIGFNCDILVELNIIILISYGVIFYLLET